jgi:hypothetical protein
VKVQLSLWEFGDKVFDVRHVFLYRRSDTCLAR